MISPKLVILLIAVSVVLFTIFYGSQIISQQLDQENKTTKITDTKNPYIKEYSLPTGTAPNAILADDNGIVWTIGSNSDLVKFDSKKEQIESFYKIKESSEAKKGPLMAWTILKDEEGFLWFSRLGESKLWHFDPQIEEFKTFVTTAPAFQMKLDQSTGDIWFVTLSGNTAGVVQKINSDDIESEYRVSEFWLGNNTTPTGLFVKHDRLWITKMSSSNEHGGTGKLSEYTITRNENGLIENVSEAANIPYFVFQPTDVFVNDIIWFSEHGSSTIVQYDKITKNLKRFPTSQNQYQTKTLPLWLKETADKSGFWFNEHGGNRIGFFNITSMKMTEYEIPSKPSDGYVVYPLNLSVDPKQNKLWFSEWNMDKIGVVDGSLPVPFDIETDKKEILRHSDALSQADTVKVTILPKQGVNDIIVFLNSTTSWNLLGFDYIRSSLVPNVINLKDGNTAEMTIQHSISATINYTLATSVSNGMVTRTTFVELNN